MAVVLAVAGGGAMGAVARFGVSWLAARLMGSADGGWPWGTATVNVLGCFLVGAVMAAVLDSESGGRLATSPAWRAGVLVGVLGGFTTFSTYAWEGFDLLSRGQVWRAAGYVVGSQAIGLLAVWAGWKIFVRV